MARKARKKSASRAKKKRAAVTKKKRKTAKNKQPRPPARRKAARKAKPKGMIAEIAGGFGAVMDTLTEAERLHHKLEPRPAQDQDPE